jgi:hypothetical protein
VNNYCRRDANVAGGKEVVIMNAHHIVSAFVTRHRFVTALFRSRPWAARRWAVGRRARLRVSRSAWT